MNPRRTHESNTVYRLPGGTEDSDMWAVTGKDDEDNPVIVTTWEPTDDERQRIANGENIALIIWGDYQPPVKLATIDVELGKDPGTNYSFGHEEEQG